MAKLPVLRKKTMAKVESTLVTGIVSEFQSPESSNIDGARYNGATREMTVYFRKGPPYFFAEIPAGVWAGFVASSSKGSYFSTLIRPMYTGVRQDVRSHG